MAIDIVRLGSPRHPDEGLRIGTVRWPPRGVPKDEIAQRDLYDVWLPELAPSADLIREWKHDDAERDWRWFARRYRAEMKQPGRRRLLDLLAALSRQTEITVGCYCVDASRCHRSVLQQLLEERGAVISPRSSAHPAPGVPAGGGTDKEPP